MHTFWKLKERMFTIEIEEACSHRSAIFSGHRHERLGVVVTTPLGGLGASLFMQLGITAYYDGRETRQVNPHYPELYVFHVGGSFGEYSLFDAWPARKQVFLPNDGALALATINNCGITHLLLPDEPAREERHNFIEPNAALDRLERCFLYSPTGKTVDANISIRTEERSVLDDVFNIINLKQAIHELVSQYPAPTDIDERRDTDEWVAAALLRLDDIDDSAKSLALMRREALGGRSCAIESYREISPREAIRRLGRVPASFAVA